MSKYKIGDVIRVKNRHSVTAIVFGIYISSPLNNYWAWLLFDDGDILDFTYKSLDEHFEVIIK